MTQINNQFKRTSSSRSTIQSAAVSRGEAAPLPSDRHQHLEMAVQTCRQAGTLGEGLALQSQHRLLAVRENRKCPPQSGEGPAGKQILQLSDRRAPSADFDPVAVMKFIQNT
jgi:hypothetical protein